MWEKIETWHWTMLVAVISVLSVLLFQQQVLAQWTPPTDTPGGTNLERIVVTPMGESLDMGGNAIVDPTVDANFSINPSAAIDIQASKADFDELCIAGDCNVAWPTGGGSGGMTSLWSTSTVDSNDIYYTTGQVGIGTNNPAFLLHLKDGGGNLKFQGNQIYHPESSELNIKSGGDLRLEAGSIPRVFIESTNGNVGINDIIPDYPLHITDNNNTSIVNIDNTDADLWTGTRLARDGGERWFMGMGDTASGTGDELLFRANGNKNIMTLKSNGRVGIGVTNPVGYLEIRGDEPADSVDLRLINDTGQDSMIAFRGYTGTTDDFSIKWSGRNPGDYDNWLQFWGRYPTGNGRPVMTMQRDYQPDEGQYQGVGIGVAAGEQIDTTLRVQNYNTEDILQLYDNGTEVFTVTDGGDVGIGNKPSFGKLNVLEHDSAGLGIFSQVTDATAGFAVIGLNTNGYPGTSRALGALGIHGNSGFVGIDLTAGVLGLAKSAGSIGVYGGQSTGAYAGYFDGDVEVHDGNLGVTSNKDTTYNYIQLDLKNGYPIDSDCDEEAEQGRMFWSNDYNKIFICGQNAGTPNWRYLYLSGNP